MTGSKAGFVRAYLVRDAGMAEPAEDGAELAPLRFVAATEGRQADGIDLRMAGVDLDRYAVNPVVLWGHQYYGRESIPIGKAVATVDGTSLLAEITFDPADEFAALVDSKYRNGFLNAVSIGFCVTKWEQPEVDSYWRGGVALEWELNEISAVPVPMDPDALLDTSRAALRSLGRELVDLFDRPPAAPVTSSLEVAEFDIATVVRAVLIEELDRRGLTTPPPPGGDTEPDLGLDTSAARAFLAAFDTKGTPAHE